MVDSNCSGGDCGCNTGGQLGRRDLMRLAGLTGAAALVANVPATAGPFVNGDFAKLIPRDKKLNPKWVAALFARGEPKTYRGRDLRYIGMPVGGLFCGTVYLGGDGRLWLWDIFNGNRNGILPGNVQFYGNSLDAVCGSAYVQPPTCDDLRVLEQGFTISVRDRSGTIERSLDRDGFADVTFIGQYPIGVVRYRDPAVPVAVELEAFSPFIPLNIADSSLPLTILAFRLENTSAEPVEVELTGRLENAACRSAQYWSGTRRNEVIAAEGVTILHQSVASDREQLPERPEIVFEDWSKATYEGWKVQGTAFGKGPIAKREIPEYQGDVGGPTERVVNSHASAPGDAATGRLTSDEFTIERRFIRLWVGGGAHAGRTCVNLLVNGQVVRSETGRNDNRMTERTWSVREFEGKRGVIQIVDEETGGWGNIGVGQIAFSDRPVGAVTPEMQPDFGSMALALLGEPAEISSGRAQAALTDRLIGRLGRRAAIAPGRTVEVVFAVAWHFPNAGILERNRRHYAARFQDAADVVRFVAQRAAALSSQTRLWRDTWYDSTLPHWFLDRTFANTANLATTTCHRFEDGRFWAWEGVGCCAGTCTHVWHYAHALARLFPQIERDQRERVDFGLALHADGTMRFRAEHNNDFAVDGQCGRVLGVYREHLMSADDAFLRRIWPKVRLATERIMRADPKRDGLLMGPLHNTLDADWLGYVPWLCGLYHAALRAAEEMARIAGDESFARSCRAILDVAAKNLDEHCWSEDYQYYVHRGDPAKPDHIGAYDGCHIDQVFGQSWAWQVGLGQVMTPRRVRTALRSLWAYNFTPDVGPWRREKQAGRWYALAGDGGLIMVTYPFGNDPKFSGAGAWSAGYFNECMSGFEHQAASHMMWEGMVLEALAITRAIHDRYDGRLRNPYNEVECSDHYARAMASYGTYLAACGFEYDGPKGHIGFAPRLGEDAKPVQQPGEDAPLVPPKKFRAAFTVAEGWGTFAQEAQAGGLHAEFVVRWGSLRLRSVGLAPSASVQSVEVKAGDRVIPASIAASGDRAIVGFDSDIVIEPGTALRIVLRTG